MFRISKITALLLTITILSVSFFIPASAYNPYADVNSNELSVSAKAALLMDADSGTVLFSKNADERLPMASTTKIMTALVAVEHGDLDKKYTIPAEATGIEGSSIYLIAGEQLTLRELVYALMLESANDAATAIALIVAGGIEEFADMMNDTVKALGLEDTHFINPHGLDHEDHYTTAYDLAAIAAYALKNDTFREIVSTRKAKISYKNTEGARLLVNHNRLLRCYDGSIGVKTGFTKRCGRCLVSAAERDGMTLVAVTLNAPDDWQDHTNMLDWGFASYTRVMLADVGEFKVTMPLCGGVGDSVVCSNNSKITVTLPADHGKIFCRVDAPHFLFAPVKNGDVIGRVVYMCDGRIIGESELQCANVVDAKRVRRSFFEWLRDLFIF